MDGTVNILEVRVGTLRCIAHALSNAQQPTLTAEVNERASRMVRRHVDDLSLDEAMLVLKTACLLKFTGDVWRETDNNKRIFMTMLEFRR